MTVGNQVDVTIGRPPRLPRRRPGDRACSACTWRASGRSMRRSSWRPRAGSGDGGRTVVLYRAGRTSAGAAASASHTASIAGDVVAVPGAGPAGGGPRRRVARRVRRPRCARPRCCTGARSGAGGWGRCRTPASSASRSGTTSGSLELAAFDAATAARLGELLAGAGAGAVVDVHNPLDVTPMADDAAFVAMAEAVLASPGVDVGVVGIVPLTAALATLAPGPGHAEDMAAAMAVAAGLVDLWRRTSKAWVASWTAARCTTRSSPPWRPAASRSSGRRTGRCGRWTRSWSAAGWPRVDRYEERGRRAAGPSPSPTETNDGQGVVTKRYNSARTCPFGWRNASAGGVARRVVVLGHGSSRLKSAVQSHQDPSIAPGEPSVVGGTCAIGEADHRTR